MRTIVLVGVLSAYAIPSAAHGSPPFRLETRREAILLGSAATLGVTALGLGAHVEPLSPAEIAALDPQDINDFDRDGVVPYEETLAGDALLAASYAIPLALLAAPEMRRDWRTLGVMWTEAVFLQLGVNGIVKSVVQRTRPYVYDAATPLEHKTTTAARLSFYSGHTSQAAVNCFFTARIVSSYTTNKRLEALVWSGAALLPIVTASLRMDSGHHFRTDVIAGYCVGATVGVLVPELHRVRGLEHLQPAAVDGGLGLALRFGN